MEIWRAVWLAHPVEMSVLIAITLLCGAALALRMIALMATFEGEDDELWA